MSSHEKQVVYLCDVCKTTQMILFTPKMKEEFLPKDLNGLALYSHSHMCANGMIGVNNLYIDHNLDVRSYNFLKLPKYVPKKKMVIPMPGKPVDNDNLKFIHITHINSKNDLNIILFNEMTGTEIQIGTFDKKNTSPQKIVKSEMEMVILKYYYSNTMYTSQIEKWLVSLTCFLEMIPPSKLGIIVEVFRYILEEKNKMPTKFEQMIMKTILASHEIFFTNNNTNMDTAFLTGLYGEAEGKTMQAIMELIDENPLMALHQYSQKLNEEIVYTIYCFLILEKHGLITINRPGIITY